MYVPIGGKMKDLVEEQNKPTKGTGADSLANEMKKDVKIEAGARFGFWATCVGTLLVAFLAGTAAKQTVDDPLPPPPPQPAGPPPVA
jgi:hypothetical protein